MLIPSLLLSRLLSVLLSLLLVKMLLLLCRSNLTFFPLLFPIIWWPRLRRASCYPLLHKHQLQMYFDTDFACISLLHSWIEKPSDSPEYIDTKSPTKAYLPREAIPRIIKTSKCPNKIMARSDCLPWYPIRRWYNLHHRDHDTTLPSLLRTRSECHQIKPIPAGSDCSLGT